MRLAHLVFFAIFSMPYEWSSQYICDDYIRNKLCFSLLISNFNTFSVCVLCCNLQMCYSQVLSQKISVFYLAFSNLFLNFMYKYKIIQQFE